MTVYFLKSLGNGMIKIGHSRSVMRRVATLSAALPEGCEILGCMPGGQEDEAQLHAAFAEARYAGEWFHPIPDLVAFIDAMAVAEIEDEGSVQSDARDRADVLLASRLMKRVGGSSEAGDGVGVQMARAIDRLRWTHMRGKSIWYAAARRISGWEMRELTQLANERWVDSASAVAIQSVEDRLARVEAVIARFDIPELRPETPDEQRNRTAAGEDP